MLHVRIVLFLLLCIPLRLAFAEATRHTKGKVALLALIPATGFIYLSTVGRRDTGAETFGQPIYWQKARPAHAALYVVSAVLFIVGLGRAAHVPLYLDAALGLSVFVIHHLFLSDPETHNV